MSRTLSVIVLYPNYVFSEFVHQFKVTSKLTSVCVCVCIDSGVNLSFWAYKGKLSYLQLLGYIGRVIPIYEKPSFGFGIVYL